MLQNDIYYENLHEIEEQRKEDLRLKRESEALIVPQSVIDRKEPHTNQEWKQILKNCKL